MNARGGSKAAVTARTKIGWLKFRECGELLNRRKFLLKMIGWICWRCVRSAVPILARNMVSEVERYGNFKKN